VLNAEDLGLNLDDTDEPPSDYENADEADVAPYDSDSESAAIEPSDASPKRSSKRHNSKTEERDAELNRNGVIYIGHIPYGFFESQMREYFSQFGQVLSVRLARNRRTGHSKHYAFVQFADPETAATVTEVMHGYFLYGRTLVVQQVPPERVHAEMLREQTSKPVPWRKIARLRHNRPRSDAAQVNRVHRLVRRHRRVEDRLQALGIDYQFEGYARQLQPAEHSEEPKSKKRQRR